ncbi:MAG: hypothetical protein M3441_13095 [Chloroflexota bacterium]|nr:hypothetical protein [Chloroflexota bacterium]
MLRKNKDQKRQEVGGLQSEGTPDALSEKLKGLNTADASDVDAFDREKEKKKAQRAQYDEDLVDPKVSLANPTVGYE